jgi:predicted nucleic acid-binding protein
LLKELLFVFDENKFIDKLELFNYSPNFKRVNLIDEEYNLAKKIKRKNQDISFYDIIHMLLAKKTNSILVTRDKQLIQFAEKHFCSVKKPEEIL